MLGWKKSGAADVAAKLEAVGRSQAVIEFNLDGTIITANQNFLGASATRLPRSRASITACSSSRPIARAPNTRSSGKSCGAANTSPPSTSGSAKGGKEVWIEASYNPVRDAAGKPVKVIKFATDITAKKMRSHCRRRQDRGDRSRAGRDRVQARRHNRRPPTRTSWAPSATRSDEIQGKHHSMFMPQADARQRRLPRILGRAEPRRIPGRRIQADRQGRQGNLDPGLLQPDSRREGQAVRRRQIRHRRDGSRSCGTPTSPARSTRSASRRR